MEVIRTVAFKYEPTPQMLKLLSDFRDMVNFCIQKALEIGSWSIKALHRACYPELKVRYDYNALYHARAYRIACQILSSWYKRAKRGEADPDKPPQARKLFVRLHKLLFRLEGNVLRVSIRPKQSIVIELRGGEYQAKFIERYARGEVKVGEITINTRYIYIPFVEEVDITAPNNYVGVDVNENNITMADNEGKTVVIDTKTLRTTHATYQNIRRRIQSVGGHRWRSMLLAKYRGREGRKVRDMLHKLSKAVVMMCQGKGVVLEDLKGIKCRDRGRKLNRRFNNSWNPRRLQFYIAYKAHLAGLPVFYVHPARTSRDCPRCGGRIASSPERACLGCGLDRDVAASINILYRFWCLEEYDERPRSRSRSLRMRGALGSPESLSMTGHAAVRGEVGKWGLNTTPIFRHPSDVSIKTNMIGLFP